jgi:subtilisin family serine protease
MTYFKACMISIFFAFTSLICHRTFGQSSSNKVLPRDWYKKDPEEDSIAGISLDKAYGLLKGKKYRTVVVAVIDNGVDINHEDLKNIIWTNTKEISGNGIDDDGNGYIDDVHGWNFRGGKDGTVIENEQSGSTQFYQAWKDKFEKVDTSRLSGEDKKKFIIYTKAKEEYIEKLKSKDSMDVQVVYNLKYNSSSLIANDSGSNQSQHYGSPYMKLSKNLSHGTHVAGIIAAEQDNNLGIDGIANHVLIMPILATTALGDERDKDVANAIRYAVNNGAQIINMSFSKLFSSDKRFVDDAIKYAERKNVLIIHAAGNDGVDIDSVKNYHYPIAVYEDGTKADNFITVGWSRGLFDYRLAHPYSNYGKDNVDIFAPGSDIYSTVPDNEYDFKSGSSMSTPVVAGVAALLMSYFPSLSAKQVKVILLESSYKPNQIVNKPQTNTQVPFNSLSVTGGIINACNAVKMAIRMAKNAP